MSGRLRSRLLSSPSSVKGHISCHCRLVVIACFLRACKRRHEAKRVRYRYWVTPDGIPRRLDMRGTNALSGAHFDHWRVARA